MPAAGTDDEQPSMPIVRTLGQPRTAGTDKMFSRSSGNGSGTGDAQCTAAEGEQMIEDAALDSQLPNGWRLYPYQQEAVRQIIRQQRVILAFDMGLGKTLISLVAARVLQRTTQCRVLVLCPVSVMSNWQQLAAALGVVISLHSWAKVPTPAQEIQRGRNFMLVADEAHNMQNLRAKRTQAALALASAACSLVLATGTPAKNASAKNIFPLLAAIRHPLALDRDAFERRYCTIAEDTSETHDRLVELHGLIGGAMLRKTKAECLDLHSKKRHLQDVSVSAEYAAKYHEQIDMVAQQKCCADAMDVPHQGEADSVCSQLGDLEGTSKGQVKVYFKLGNSFDARAQISARGQLFRLRNLASSAKVPAAVEIATDLLAAGRSVAVCTCFKTSAKDIHAALTSAGMTTSCELLTGEVPQYERQKMVQRFAASANEQKRSAASAFVFTCGAGGIGITLTAAADLIMVDRALTPGDVEQAEDRICRIGQLKAVNVWWLRAFAVCKLVDDMLQEKQHRINRIVEDGANSTNASELSPTELLRLLLEDRGKSLNTASSTSTSASMAPVASASSLFERCASRLAGGTDESHVAESVVRQNSHMVVDEPGGQDPVPQSTQLSPVTESRQEPPSCLKSATLAMESWKCPTCRSDHLSVMPHVAARWSADGCPRCLGAKIDKKASMRRFQQICSPQVSQDGDECESEDDEPLPLAERMAVRLGVRPERHRKVNGWHSQVPDCASVSGCGEPVKIFADITNCSPNSRPAVRRCAHSLETS